ncbi:hypothetical protein ACVW00_003338 [Marmoricola sp. URHA0025 HA25]
MPCANCWAVIGLDLSRHCCTMSSGSGKVVPIMVTMSQYSGTLEAIS